MAASLMNFQAATKSHMLQNFRQANCCKQGCRVGVGVAMQESEFLCGVEFFHPTSTTEVQLNHFLHRTLKSGILTRAC